MLTADRISPSALSAIERIAASLQVIFSAAQRYLSLGPIDRAGIALNWTGSQRNRSSGERPYRSRALRMVGTRGLTSQGLRPFLASSAGVSCGTAARVS